MFDTLPIASFHTGQGADAAAAILREHSIQCAVVRPSRQSGFGAGALSDLRYTLVVDNEDEQTARQLITHLPDDSA